MKIAIPIENGMLCPHFGHAPKFAIVEVSGGAIGASQLLEPPPHEPGSLPKWLKGLGVTQVICGGIGARAVQLLQEAGIQVSAGVSPQDPAKVVEDLLAGRLVTAQGPTCSGHGDSGVHHQCGHH